MPKNTDAPVVVENLSHFYGKGALQRQILFDVSTVIPAGEIVIVTGPSSLTANGCAFVPCWVSVPANCSLMA